MPQPRVLVIEDDPAIRDVLREALEDEHYAVEITDGQTALGRARAFAPDVILLDLHMPGSVPGDEVFCRLRDDPATRAIPICISSALPKAGSIAQHLGADGVLLKPFDLSLLDDELRKLVQASYQRRKANEASHAGKEPDSWPSTLPS